MDSWDIEKINGERFVLRQIHKSAMRFPRTSKYADMMVISARSERQKKISNAWVWLPR